MKFILIMLVAISVVACKAQQVENIEQVLPGAYSVEQYLPKLENKTVALVVNHTSFVGDKHLVDTLLSLDVDVHLIFTPEHGFKGNADAGEIIENEDTYANISVQSLYGNNKKPKAEYLSNIDIVLFDLQDVGARFYTYISTLHYVMEACAESDIPVVVLDRPNPHCHYVDGPILQSANQSFVGMHPVPVVYGMTIGEYGLMINGQYWLKDSIQCRYSVIPNINFRRSADYKLPIAPSPNLPNMNSVYLYPSLCFFEGTVYSLGRGTDYPFQVYGHPQYPDTSFSFTPESRIGACRYPKLENTLCYGIDLTAKNERQDKIELKYLLDAYQQYEDKGAFFTNYFILLAGTDKLQEQIVEGMSEVEIRQSWQPNLVKFKKVREKYLIYSD